MWLLNLGDKLSPNPSLLLVVPLPVPGMSFSGNGELHRQLEALLMDTLDLGRGNAECSVQ